MTQQDLAPGAAVAYLVSRYPAVSHTFILREVLGLRALGLRVEVASVNPPDRAATEMSAEELAEARATYGIKRDGLIGALTASAWALFTRPLRLAACLRQALGHGRGVQRLYGLAYAVEAMMVLRWMERRELHHLHVHFGNAAATVGTLVKTLGADVGLSLTIHGPDEFDDVPGQRLPQKMAAADRVVCISQFARSQLMRLSAPADWPKLSLCRLGVDPAQFKGHMLKRADAPVRLLCVGRLTPAKGQLLLLQACAQLRGLGLSLELRLVGAGPDRARLERETERLGLQAQVSFTGPLNQAQVRAELAAADVFVLPSLAEGIPVVLMEAMASGVPCVSSPVNGIPELIEHEVNGLLAAPGDVDALTLQLRRLLEDKALRERLAGAGMQQIWRRFNLNDNVARLAGLFRELPHVGWAEAAR